MESYGFVKNMLQHYYERCEETKGKDPDKFSFVLRQFLYYNNEFSSYENMYSLIEELNANALVKISCNE